MTELGINRIIHEARGLCWHEWEQIYTCGGSRCKHCQKYYPVFPNAETAQIIQDTDYTKWEHYGPMLEWAMKKEWGRKLLEGYALNGCIEILLNPRRGSTAIAEFLKERKP